MGAGLWTLRTTTTHPLLYELEPSSDLRPLPPRSASVTISATSIWRHQTAQTGWRAESLLHCEAIPNPKLPDNAKAWASAPWIDDFASSDRPAVFQRMRTNSELKELWTSPRIAAKWYATLDDVSSRLTPDEKARTANQALQANTPAPSRHLLRRHLSTHHAVAAPLRRVAELAVLGASHVSVTKSISSDNRTAHFARDCGVGFFV